ncbi:O-antigen ligase [Oceanobacillus sp. Castelsardo]|uniref:O-antigen ligase family protein n=1 Tax=Oceanobacillus sp. Castelsardo TaxID=1851204 RepID=UPI000837DCD0|nr:O-antigen ligase family protein [Oceanobacillus sp. Castelsardo]
MKNYKGESLFLVQLFVLVFFNTFQRSQFDVLKDIGLLSIYLTLFIMFLFLIRSFIYHKAGLNNLKMIYIAISLLIFINTISFVFTKNVNTTYFIQVIFLFLFILGSIRIKWDIQSVKLFGYVTSVFFLFIWIHGYVLDFPNRFVSIYNNPNYLGVLLFCMLYFQIVSWKYSHTIMEKIYFSIVILANLFLIYMTNSRSVLLAILIVIIVWFILRHTKKVYSYLFYAILLINFAFLFTYTKLKGTELGNSLNELSLEYTNKNLFSGRSEIWEQLFIKISEKPIWGHGMGIRASDIISIPLTAHNQYLQIVIEVGFIGLVIFLFLLYTVWKLLLKNRDNDVAKLSAAFFIAILAYENLELTLFQNNYSIAILQWLIITIGISFNENVNEKS